MTKAENPNRIILGTNSHNPRARIAADTYYLAAFTKPLAPGVAAELTKNIELVAGVLAEPIYDQQQPSAVKGIAVPKEYFPGPERFVTMMAVLGKEVGYDLRSETIHHLGAQTTQAATKSSSRPPTTAPRANKPYRRILKSR